MPRLLTHCYCHTSLLAPPLSLLLSPPSSGPPSPPPVAPPPFPTAAIHISCPARQPAGKMVGSHRSYHLTLQVYDPIPRPTAVDPQFYSRFYFRVHLCLLRSLLQSNQLHPCSLSPAPFALYAPPSQSFLLKEEVRPPRRRLFGAVLLLLVGPLSVGLLSAWRRVVVVGENTRVSMACTEW